MSRWWHRFWGGCWHQRYTFPQTRQGETSVTCLACGKRMRYDWQAMKVMEA
jgi:RNase P subunit RPR2